MARAVLLHLLGAYFFDNGGQTVSLQWLTLFQDFGEARRANWGKACLAYLYSTPNTLSRGTLQQLMGLGKLLEVSFLSISWISFVACSFANCTILKTVILQTVVLHTVILHLTCDLCFFF